MFAVRSSTSTNNGSAPRYRTTSAVAVKVYGVVSTCMPGPTPSASSARCRPAVAEFRARAWGIPAARAKASSNRAVTGPVVSQPERSTAITPASSSGPMLGRAKGMGAGVPRGAAPPPALEFRLVIEGSDRGDDLVEHLAQRPAIAEARGPRGVVVADRAAGARARWLMRPLIRVRRCSFRMRGCAVGSGRSLSANRRSISFSPRRRPVYTIGMSVPGSKP